MLVEVQLSAKKCLLGTVKRGIFYKNIFSEEMTFNLKFWYSKM